MPNLARNQNIRVTINLQNGSVIECIASHADFTVNQDTVNSRYGNYCLNREYSLSLDNVVFSEGIFKDITNLHPQITPNNKNRRIMKKNEGEKVIIIEKKMNLFEVDDKYHFAHCISADYALGAGIAVEFQKRFHLRDKLKNYGGIFPDCILIDRVFNLVTKKICYGKPTYATLRSSLNWMKQLILANDIKYLAIPKIGCGLDRLQWGKVREIIKEVFNDIDIEILVCYQ